MASYVTIHMDSLGALAIDGHHYQQIYMPDSSFVSAAQAQASVIGLECTWYDMSGNRQTYVVTDSSFQGEPTRVVLPLDLEVRIELRLAWRIPVGPGMPDWFVYVDTMDGELLMVERRFWT